MFLKHLLIKNFRSIKELELHFNCGLNILIGENNSGKTAVIDALRICLGYGKQWRDLFIRKSDFHIDKTNPNKNFTMIEFHLTFEIEKPEETGWFNDLLVQKADGNQELQIHFNYYIEERNGIEKIRYKIWGGEHLGQQITPEVLELFYFVYLDALRDAEHNLRPIRGNRLGELYSGLSADLNGNIIDTDKRLELANRVKNALGNDQEWMDLIETGMQKVNEHLVETSIVGKEQNVEIDFLPFEFRRIVDNLRIQFPIFKSDIIVHDQTKQKYFEIFQNGLGYNNLLYTATVLGDLKNKKQIEPETYISLLIEEPEAHLHPQLQNIFFNYLNKLDKTGFQIFVTSHSPTITAKAPLDSLIVLQNNENVIKTFSIKKSNLSEVNKKYLTKFLDVTKSQLFFSNGVIFVEGISEALLISKFSKLIGKNEEYNIEKKGIEIVIVNGVAFEHFAKLFNAEEESKRLNIRSVIITDDDRSSQTGEVPSRAQNALNLKGGLLNVEIANITFEYELFLAGESNRQVLIDIFRSMHPVAAKRIDQGNSIEEYAENFLNKVISNKAKSELSYQLALKLDDDLELCRTFKVPTYIEQAIKWVVKGE